VKVGLTASLVVMLIGLFMVFASHKIVHSSYALIIDFTSAFNTTDHGKV